MQKIIPHLWFDKEAKEAAEFYVSVFGKNSKITHASVLKNTPSGDCDVLSFDLWGYSFMSISAGPYFTLNPSISFMVNFDPSQHSDAKENIDVIWNKLADGGNVLMELGTYPFSERYGWVQDKYGVSWQLILTKPEGEDRPLIMPSLLFTNDVCGKAEEAIDFYVSTFEHSKKGQVAHYTAGMEPNKEGTLMFGECKLENQWIVAMDSALKHTFQFNEAISLLVQCENQEEIDHYWNALSAVPEAEQCGWLKDKYGVSWQINPADLQEIMNGDDQEKIDRVTKAFLQMKKFDLATLRKAAAGE